MTKVAASLLDLMRSSEQPCSRTTPTLFSSYRRCFWLLDLLIHLVQALAVVYVLELVYMLVDFEHYGCETPGTCGHRSVEAFTSVEPHRKQRTTSEVCKHLEVATMTPSYRTTLFRLHNSRQNKDDPEGSADE
ncbi:hypothetical protein M514_00789 [Trichuris suis]|uniref:Uncharacterized protein n=1 Tax=Trichuris suis TaxID=68888 RepID=A0A085N9B6_9BILA|nr:hypothetical protein M513_00789 [Trichuris suis]KFD66062.1 hypothetical protein M514_00789 [Trichuris suis]